MKLISFLICTFSLSAFSQKLENQKAVSAGERIVITYDLQAEVPGDKYDVQIYSSHNNFSTQLKNTTGDIGNGVTPGIGKRIEWEAKKEIGNYQGELSFEIRADVKAVFAYKNSIPSTKRGKSLTVSWRGGVKTEDVKVILLNEGIEQSTLSTSGNYGSFDWSVPAKHKTGGSYQIRLDNGKESVTSNYFSLKQKIPMIVKILPVAVIGALVVFWPKSPPEPSSENLATPPDLGLN